MTALFGVIDTYRTVSFGGYADQLPQPLPQVGYKMSRIDLWQINPTATPWVYEGESGGIGPWLGMQVLTP